jgi:hypothetical protein
MNKIFLIWLVILTIIVIVPKLPLIRMFIWDCIESFSESLYGAVWDCIESFKDWYNEK